MGRAASAIRSSCPTTPARFWGHGTGCVHEASILLRSTGPPHDVRGHSRARQASCRTRVAAHPYVSRRYAPRWARVPHTSLLATCCRASLQRHRKPIDTPWPHLQRLCHRANAHTQRHAPPPSCHENGIGPPHGSHFLDQCALRHPARTDAKPLPACTGQACYTSCVRPSPHT